MTTTLTLIKQATRKAFLSPREALLLLRMAGWVLLLSVAAKYFPLPRALRLLSTKTRTPTEIPKEDVQRRLAEAIDLLLKADFFIFKPSCWKRSALLHRYLALNGISTQILFGVRKEVDGSVAGHAWLEASNGPILEASVPNYAVTYSFPSLEAIEVDPGLLSRMR